MSNLKSRVIYINSRRTSVRLCQSEWSALEDICSKEKIKRSSLIEAIENNKSHKLGLTSAIRLFSIIYYHKMAAEYMDKNIYKNYFEQTIKRIG